MMLVPATCAAEVVELWAVVSECDEATGPLGPEEFQIRTTAPLQLVVSPETVCLVLFLLPSIMCSFALIIVGVSFSRLLLRMVLRGSC